jgi:hypothetical protein
MAKGQKKSTRETRKPKQEKTKETAPVGGFQWAKQPSDSK